jgi:Na+(H+)/acetate symporter ActP
MTRNMGTIDRIVRALVALVIIGLYLAGQLTGVAAIVLGILAAVLILTSAVGWCPLYVPFHLSTRRRA